MPIILGVKMKNKIIISLIIIINCFLLCASYLTSGGSAAAADYIVVNAAPAEPIACNALANVGIIVYVYDTDAGVRGEFCVCQYDDNPGVYDWKETDVYDTACPFF